MLPDRRPEAGRGSLLAEPLHRDDDEAGGEQNEDEARHLQHRRQRSRRDGKRRGMAMRTQHKY